MHSSTIIFTYFYLYFVACIFNFRPSAGVVTAVHWRNMALSFYENVQVFSRNSIHLEVLNVPIKKKCDFNLINFIREENENYDVVTVFAGIPSEGL